MVSLGQHQETSNYQISQYKEMSASGMSNAHEDRKSSVVVDSWNEFPVVSTGERRRYFRLDDIPNCNLRVTIMCSIPETEPKNNQLR